MAVFMRDGVGYRRSAPGHLSVPRGGPVTLRPPTPHHGGMGDLRNAPRTGQIIPPLSKGQHPRGSSLPGYYQWGSPQPKPGVPTPFTSDWTGPGSWNNAYKMAKLGRLAQQLGRMSPVGRAMNLGFQLLDLWQQTKEENPFEHGPGWELFCESGPGPYSDYRVGITRSATACAINLGCGTTLQLTSGTWGPGSSVISDYPGGSCFGTGGQTRAASIAFGPGYGEGLSRRMDFHRVYRACWSRACNTFGQPGDPGPIRYAPRVVQPMPANLTPPKGRPDPYPRERTRARSRTSPRTGPRTKPAPYEQPQPNGRPPHVHVPTKPGHKKWKFPDYGIPGDIYGWLTELKDGLKCFEKNLAGHRIPKGAGLAGRVHAAAQYAWLNPEKLDAPGFIKCLVYNHFEDKAIGKANQLANRITQSPYWQRPVGVGAGSWSVRM